MREVTERVRVYWNLHKKCWSVQSCKTNRVVLHTDELTIYKPAFVVRKAGQKRVREERTKNVHAFVVGTMTLHMDDDLPDNCRVSYNPFRDDTFMQQDKPIRGALYAKMVTSEMGRPTVYAMVA